MTTEIYKEKLKIKEVSSILGISCRTLRFYEELGLIHPQKKTNGTRLYGEDDLDRMRFILRLKAVGLDLKEIRDLAVIHKGEKDIFHRGPMVIEILEIHSEKITRQLDSLGGLKKDLLTFRRKIKEILSAGWTRL